MKNIKHYLLIAVLISCFTACNNDDDGNTDTIYEFVSFQKENVLIAENTGTSTAVPIVLDLLGYEPKSSFTIRFDIIDTNVERGTDYTLSADEFTFKKGMYTSDTLYVSTIDNDFGADYERSFTLKLKEASVSNLKMGLGIETPELNALEVMITDDECTETTDIFNATLSNELENTQTSISGNLNGDMLKLTGDIIGYSPFANASLEVKLTPETAGAMDGSAVFDTYDAGIDNDGYVYQFRQAGTGSYDVCAGQLQIGIDIYYESGGAWLYWYTSTNTITVN